jgi:signal transduction histidine kinase/CheY-like chemotaxis protein
LLTLALFVIGSATALFTRIASMMAVSTLLVAVVAWYFGTRAALAAFVAAHVVSAVILNATQAMDGMPGSGPVMTLLPVWLTELSIIGLIAVHRRTVAAREGAQVHLTESLSRLEMSMQLARVLSFDWNPTQSAFQWGSTAAPASVGGATHPLSGPRGQDYIQHIHPDDRPRMLHRFQGLTRNNARYRETYRIVGRGGELVWLEETGQGEFDEQGQLTRLWGIAIDITHRKEMEEALQRHASMLSESHDALEVAQAIARSGNWSFDRATGAITWSRQLYELHGRPEHLGPPTYGELLNDYRPEDAQRLVACVEQALQDGTPYSLVLRTSLETGTCYMRTEARARYDAEGAIIGLMGTCTDVTAEVEREQALLMAQQSAEEANRVKSEFLATMSHEIRTPLTAILGYTDLLLGEHEAELATPLGRDHLLTIKRNSGHLMAILNDILDLSRIEANKMTVEHVPASPAVLLDQVCELMRVKADEKGLQLSSQLDASVPQTITTDPMRLRQILVNLIGNAIKFTESGVVKVAVSMSSEPVPRLAFDVEDTGIGMSSDQVQRVFGAFEQADSSTTRKFGGSGLGLRISQRLAEMLGGDITVTSVLGRGSTFRLRVATGATSAPALPSSQQPGIYAMASREMLSIAGASPGSVNEPAASQAVASQSVASQAVASQSVAQPLSGARILLAEDGPDNQKLITFILQRAGAQVDLVENGKRLVERMTAAGAIDAPLCPDSPYDLILTDIQMPEMDGYEATRVLREKGCVLPIIALTAHAMSGEEQRGMSAGCNAYMTKPIDRRALIEACCHWRNESAALAR